MWGAQHFMFQQESWPKSARLPLVAAVTWGSSFPDEESQQTFGAFCNCPSPASGKGRGVI